jgi:hypothetical protein
VIVLALFLVPWPQYAASQCSVEKRRTAGLLIGRFSVGPIGVTLTMPRYLGPRNYSMAFIAEVSGLDESEWTRCPAARTRI